MVTNYKVDEKCTEEFMTWARSEGRFQKSETGLVKRFGFDFGLDNDTTNNAVRKRTQVVRNYGGTTRSYNLVPKKD